MIILGGDSMKFGGIEAGGTKFVLAIGDEFGNIEQRTLISTTTPDETFDHIYEFFDQFQLDAIGVACFGPIDPDVNSPTYGYITTTPKPHWGMVDVVGRLKERYHIPVAFDTDVNGAALGELEFGSAIGLDSCLYLTIGTGIGGGAIVERKLLHGLLHPEMGHMKIIRHPEDNFEGVCPYHKDCFEGLASGPAIEARWHQKAYHLPKDHSAWDIEAYYIAQAVAAYILILSPKKIILGGGVMKQEQLFPLIRKHTQEILNGYIKKDEIIKHIDSYIVYPKLGDNAGICGALALAKNAR